VLALCAVLSATLAWARSGDFEPSSPAWNGLSELLGVAREIGVELQVLSTVDLGRLTAQDGLLLVYPQRPPPRADLSAFMVEGGRLALADAVWRRRPPITSGSHSPEIGPAAGLPCSPASTPK
jgi:hypothetical protein